MAETQNLPKAESRGSDSINPMHDVYWGTVEKTLEESPYYTKSQLKPYNPDDLWRKRSAYDIYEEMLNDDQIALSLQIKKDLTVGSDFDILPGSDDQAEMIEMLEQSLEDDLDFSIESRLEEMISSYEYGFSLTEKIFKTVRDNWLTLRDLKTRHPDTWLIHTDDQGNIEKYEQQTQKGNLDINPKSLIHMVNKPKFQNPYGTSDLRSAYYAYVSKKHVMRMYSIFLEKAASPTPVAKFDKNAPKSAVDKIFNVLKRLQTKTAMTIPKEIEVEFLEAKNTGDAFHKAINIFNMFIGRSILIPDLLGFQGDETGGGSYSLGVEQFKILYLHINRRRKTLERLINAHILKPLVMWNFGEQEKYPKFKFRPIQEEQVVELAKVWLEAVKGKTYKPSDEEINHFRSIVKFPEGDVEHAEPVSQFPPQFDPSGNKPPMDNEPDVDDKDKPTDETEGEEKKSFNFKQPEKTFAKRVNFKAIEGQLDSAEESIKSQIKPLIDLAFEDYINQIKKKKVLEKKSLERLEKIKVSKKKDIKNVLAKSFREHWKKSQEIAQGEIFKANFELPLPTDEFLTLLDEELFQYIGDWEYRFQQEARVLMTAAIKDGLPMSSVIAQMENKVLSMSQVSAERFARTKLTEVMNRSRHDYFEGTGIVSGYEYSAVLDGRTTVICAGLHGKKFPKGTEPVPPLHFNCRSLLVPITEFEEFTPDTKVGGTVKTKRAGDIKVPRREIQSFIEEFKGEGFSKQ